MHSNLRNNSVWELKTTESSEILLKLNTMTLVNYNYINLQLNFYQAKKKGNFCLKFVNT